jgi:hypothetical protein
MAAALSGNDAPDAALFQFGTDPFSGSLIGDGRGLEAIINPFVAKIGADRVRREAAEEIGILVFDPLPFLTRLFLTAQ